MEAFKHAPRFLNNPEMIVRDVIIRVSVRDTRSTPRAAAALAKRLVQLAADRARDQIPEAR